MQKDKGVLFFTSFVISIFLWFVWWTLAVTVGSVFLFLSFLIPKKRHKVLIKILSAILTYSVFIIPRHKGLKPKDIPFPVVYVPNHVSFFDLFISGLMLPGDPRGIELKKFFKLPVYGWFITRFGMIPIDPGKKSSTLKALLTAGEKLKKREHSILIMPEGMRTKDGNLSEFKNGAFFLSKKFNIPIVPVVFKNLFSINNRNSILIKPGFCDIYMLDPVYPENFDSEKELNSYVKNIISEKLFEK